MLTILYRERKYNLDFYHSDEPTDIIQVTLRKWSKASSCDVVREEYVTVDSEIVLHQRLCFDGHGHTDAEFQREAIARFDELLAAHPTLSRLQEN